MTITQLALDSSRFIQIQDDVTREVVRDINTLLGSVRAGSVVSFAQTVPATLLANVVTTTGGAVSSAITLTSQTQNLAFLSPNGSSGVPSFRAILGADLPSSVYGSQSANVIYSGPTSGGAAAPTFRAMVVADLPAAVYGTQAANVVYAGPTSGGSVAPVFRALVVADLPSTVYGTQAANTFYAGPISGGAVAPAFRAIVAADLPVITVRTATTTPVTVTAAEAAVGAVIYVKLAAPGAVAVSLPTGVTGYRVTVKDGTGDAAANNITVTPAAGNIDGAATDTIAANRAARTYVYTGAEWSIT